MQNGNAKLEPVDVWAGDVVWTPEGTWSGGQFYSRHASADLYTSRCEIPPGMPISGDDKTRADCEAKFDTGFFQGFKYER